MTSGIIEDGGAGVQTQQPRSGASANLRHPVLRGLSFLWSAAQDKAEVTRRIAPSGYWTTPVLITPTPFGLAGRNAATAATRFDATKFPASTQYTYLAFVLDDAGRGSTRNFFDSDDGGSARIFQFRCTSSNTVEFIAFNTIGGNSSGSTTSATTSSTTPQVIAARSNGDGSLDMFIDGAGKTTALILLGTTVKTNSEAGAKYSIGGAAHDAAPFPGGVFWVAGWSRALSDAEIKYISAHPWQLFEAENDPVFYSLAAGGGTTVAVPAGAVTLTGYAPTVTAGGTASASVPAGAVTLTAYAPTVTTGGTASTSVPLGTVTLTGYAPTVTVGGSASIDVPLGTVALTGYAPTVTTGGQAQIDVPLGTVALAGYAPTVTTTEHAYIAVPTAAMALAAYAPTVTASGAPDIWTPVSASTGTWTPASAAGGTWTPQ